MSPCILTVDDSPETCAQVKLTLEDAGMSVVTAADGAECLEKLGDMVPDAIITDINIPHLDGFTLIQNVRQNKKLCAVPILVLTGQTAEDPVCSL